MTRGRANVSVVSSSSEKNPEAHGGESVELRSPVPSWPSALLTNNGLDLDEDISAYEERLVGLIGHPGGSWYTANRAPHPSPGHENQQKTKNSQ